MRPWVDTQRGACVEVLGSMDSGDQASVILAAGGLLRRLTDGSGQVPLTPHEAQTLATLLLERAAEVHAWNASR